VRSVPTTQIIHLSIAEIIEVLHRYYCPSSSVFCFAWDLSSGCHSSRRFPTTFKKIVRYSAEFHTRLYSYGASNSYD
jgi:hypothetical protein